MNILLGNLTIKDIENRLDVTFPEELITLLNDTRQVSADTSLLKDNEWHCFDIPFTIVCGSREFAMKIYGFLSPLAESMKEPLQISIRS